MANKDTKMILIGYFTWTEGIRTNLNYGPSSISDAVEHILLFRVRFQYSNKKN